MVACSSSGDGGGEAPPEAGFCDTLANAYAKCGGATSCSTSLGADCTKLASLLSPSVLDGAKSCVEQTACGGDPLACLGKALGNAKPSAAQTKLATDYCASCSVVGGDACTTAFFGTASVPGLAFALLPFGDAPLDAVDSACTKSALGKTACQAAFTTCLGATTTKFLATSISADSAKCLVDGIKAGVSGLGKDSGSDGSASGCTDCAGCCQDGVCKDGREAPACGAGGSACEACQGGAACTDGTCASSCGPDNCAGCCNADGTCSTSASNSACGTGGAACTACSGSKTCEKGACIDPSCKASCTAGCCTGSGCQAGNTPSACGSGGNACSVCGGGQTCTAGACQLSGTALFDFVAVGARVPVANQSGGSWDAFNGLPDAYVKATSGAATGSSPNRPDTLTPLWNATLLSGLTAAALKSSLRVDLSDADVAFDDVIGGCAVPLNGSEFDGALHTVNCPAAAGGVALSLDYRLKAH
ncbi:MAG TPA: C2 domain-containing protein [Labilithrix sp.]|nr:C2 domain-containing protein [Labilithrix sp.]